MPNEFGVCMVYGRCCTEVRRRAPYTSLLSFLHMWSWFRVLGSLCSSYLLSFWAKLDGRKQGDPRVSEIPSPAGPKIGRKACAFGTAYKLVPSNIWLEKIACMWTRKWKKFFILRNMQRKCKSPSVRWLSSACLWSEKQIFYPFRLSLIPQIRNLIPQISSVRHFKQSREISPHYAIPSSTTEKPPVLMPSDVWHLKSEVWFLKSQFSKIYSLRSSCSIFL